MQLTLATRQSHLALIQAEEVKQLLMLNHPYLATELMPMSTKGDQIQDRSLAELGGKGLFIKNLEAALVKGKADCAVHSLKDMPPQLDAGFEIIAVLKRLSPHDALVSKKGNLTELPPGSVIGTSSVRRRAELLNFRPDLKTVFIRGNVGTRLRKLDEGFCDALILAEAGLMRLGLRERITEILDTQRFLPSVGQGVIAIEALSIRPDLKALFTPFHDPDTFACIRAERAMNAALGANCTSPVGSFATVKNGLLSLQGMVLNENGQTKLHTCKTAPITEATSLGQAAAQDLLAQGAAALF